MKFDISSLDISNNPSGLELYNFSLGFQNKGCKILEDKFLLSSEITKNKPLNTALTNPNREQPADTSTKDSSAYDFLIVPSHATGSQALFHLTLWHPDIAVPRLNEVDTAIRNEDLKSLPEITKHFVNSSEGRKHGMILHNYIPGNSILLNQDLWDVTAKRMRRIVNGDTFFQVVRDPIEMLEHLLIKRVIIENLLPLSSLVRSDNSYLYNRFETMDLNTIPETWTPPVNNFTIGKGHKRSALSKLGDFMNSWVCPYLKIEDTYKNYFNRNFLIDNSDLFPKKIEPTLKIIYKEIGVDNSFIHPLAHFPMNTWINRFLYTLHLDFKYKEHQLPLGLYFANNAVHSAGIDNFELEWIAPCNDWLNLGFPDRKLCLTTPYPFWKKIPVSIRRELLKTGLLGRALHKVVYPMIFNLWKNWWEVISSAIEEMRNNEGLYHPGEFIKNNQEDLSAFLERHPELIGKWKRSNRYIH